MPKKLTLRQARVLMDITQKEMAKKLGVSLSMYRAYETYQTLMRVDKVKKFSEITEVPIQNLILQDFD